MAILGYGLQAAPATSGGGSSWWPSWLSADDVQAAAAVIALLGLILLIAQLRSSARQLRDSQLSTGAQEPVRIAHELNTLQAQLINAPRKYRVSRSKRIREMHLDLADVVSEARRTAGFVLDFAGWENYFRHLVTDDDDAAAYRADLTEYEGWYTDQMFALFGRLYVRNPETLHVDQRLLVYRPGDFGPLANVAAEEQSAAPAATAASAPEPATGRLKDWDEQPSSLGRWTFHEASANWESARVLAEAELRLRERGRSVGDVCICWHKSDETVIAKRTREEITSWIAWHLAEGGVRVAWWSNREETDPAHEREPCRPFDNRGGHRTVNLLPERRQWMDGSNPRFQLPKYGLRRSRWRQNLGR